MKTFLMYYDRYENSTTSSMLDFEHIILCHKNADKFKNISNKATVIQTDLPTGIQHNFNYALKTLEYGEWAIFLSDDLIGGRKFDEEKYDFIECPVSKVIQELKETIKKYYPKIFIEVWDKHYTKVSEVIFNMGYTMNKIDGRANYLCEKLDSLDKQ